MFFLPVFTSVSRPVRTIYSTVAHPSWDMIAGRPKNSQRIRPVAVARAIATWHATFLPRGDTCRNVQGKIGKNVATWRHVALARAITTWRHFSAHVASARDANSSFDARKSESCNKEFRPEMPTQLKNSRKNCCRTTSTKEKL